jgi:hypothetical protein
LKLKDCSRIDKELPGIPEMEYDEESGYTRRKIITIVYLNKALTLKKYIYRHSHHVYTIHNRFYYSAILINIEE